MGRTLTPAQTPYTPLIAAENIAGGDVIMQSGIDYKAYAAKFIGPATQSAGGASIYSQTGLALSGTWANDCRHQVLQAADGSVFTLEPQASGITGLVLKKFTPEGVFIASTTLNAAGTYFVSSKMVLLSSGDIAVVANSSPSIFFAIVTTSLAIVKALTLISGLLGPGTGGNKLYVMPFTGGFTVVSPGSTGVNLATLNNAGTVTTAGTSIFANFSTWWFASVGMLSNGSIVLCVYSDNAGAQYGIYSTAGAVVKAMASLPGGLAAGGSVYYYSEVSAVSGYFALAYVGVSQYQTLAVFDNTGTLQGAQAVPWTVPVMQANNQMSCKLINDGTSFYWLDAYSAGGKIAKITTTGAMTVGPSFTSVNTSFDAYYNAKTQSIVILFLSGSMYFLAQVPTASWGTLANGKYTVKLPLSGSGNGQHGILGAADGSVLFVDSLPTMILTSIKLFDASIVGVAAGAAAAGATAYVNSAPGNYATTGASYSTAKKFNHSAASVVGVAGQLFPATLNIASVTPRNIN